MSPCLSLRYASLFSGPTSDQEANKKTESIVPTESSSVREFNAVLKNGSNKLDSPSKDDSDDSLREVNDVLLEKNWQQYRKRSFVTYSQLSNFSFRIHVHCHSNAWNRLSLRILFVRGTFDRLKFRATEHLMQFNQLKYVETIYANLCDS